jgi:hypothetical protein
MYQHRVSQSTNYSFYVTRYSLKSAATLIVLYLIYVRPFAQMLFKNLSSLLQTNTAVVHKTEISRSIVKQRGKKRVKKRVNRRRVIEDNSLDLFQREQACKPT